MKRLIWLVVVVLFSTPVLPRAAATSPARQEETPYIYYYSHVLNGIVIERADGTDSRIIGQGLVDEDVLFVHGPGWSPDGRWFAWRVSTPEGYYGSGSVGKGYVTSADGQITLDILGRFPCVYSMLWHPTDDILFVYGSRSLADHCAQGAHPVATYWLIDVDAQTRLATFSIDSDQEWASTLPIYWFPDERQIQFYEAILLHHHGYNLQDFVVTMSFDGTVTMEPVSKDEADAWFEGIAPVRTAHDDNWVTLFTSWVEAAQERQIEPPPNSSAVGPAVSGQWNSAGNWLLIGYEFCWSDCAFVTGRVSIFNPETGRSREISDCGAHPTCVGWLPDRVNLANLPPGQPESVLPAPESMNYHNAFRSGRLIEVATHDIACDTETNKMSLVQNINTGEIDFVLPGAPSCSTPSQSGPEQGYPTRQIVFSLSSDQHYYAITANTEYTSLYDAETGARIAMLNFYGFELAFSEDSRTLITTGHYATATWEIQELVNRSLQ